MALKLLRQNFMVRRSGACSLGGKCAVNVTILITVKMRSFVYMFLIHSREPQSNGFHETVSTYQKCVIFFGVL